MSPWVRIPMRVPSVDGRETVPRAQTRSPIGYPECGTILQHIDGCVRPECGLSPCE